jgi:Ca2+-binding EF-hand superfamily protein
LKLGLVSDDSKAMQKKMSKAFKKFDKDGDGTINIAEIKEVFRARAGHPEAPPEFFIKMLEKMDLNGDGLVDYQEFLSHHLDDAAEVAELVAMGHQVEK